MPTPLFFRKPPNERIKRTETKDLQAMERDILFGQFRFAHCPTGYPLSACWGVPQTPEKS